MVANKWKVNKSWRSRGVHHERGADLASELCCSRILADLLINRGIDSPSTAETFLNPNLGDLHDPDLLPGMADAVQRITEGIRKGETMAVVGDYDVDGIASTALLLEFFRFIDRPVRHYIPHRLRDGYGINDSVVRNLAEEGVSLIITVDNGSTAIAAADAAHALGVDLVVTDHHLPGDELPRARAIVNPCLHGSEYPFRKLAGVGVTFKVVWALCRAFSRSRKVTPEFRRFMVDALAFVALGTIADVVPLRDENRILARYGLRALESAETAGLRHLVALAKRGDHGRVLDAEDVGFRIAPCLNAAGRLDDAEQALSLLLCRDESEAGRLLGVLKRHNEKRRDIEREIYEDARDSILSELDMEGDRVVVLAREGWHPGVIGIVASRLVEEFFRPTLLISLEGEIGKGSARSIPQVEICEALRRSRDCLEAFGGHAMAAGVRIASNRVEDLRQTLNRVVDVCPGEMIPEVVVDGEYSLSSWTIDAVRELQRLAPFGEGNPRPRFAIRGAEIVGQPRLMGSDQSHLSFFVRQHEDTALRAVAFRKADWHGALLERDVCVSLVYQPSLNRWRDRESLELLVDEIEISSSTVAQ